MTSSGLPAVARLTDALSRAVTLPAVYDPALDALQQSLGVSRASILLFDADGVMSFVAWRDLSDDYRRAVNGHTPWRPETRCPEPITVTDVYDDTSLAAYRPVFDAEGIRALGFFPLNYRDRVIGKFMLYHAEPHVFGADEVELALTIAGQIAFGVARVRAEEELQREVARQAFLAEASSVLAASLDVETTLARVGQLVVGKLADWCTIDVQGDDGEIRRVTALHRDPSREELMARVRTFGTDRHRTDNVRRATQQAAPLLASRFDWRAFEERYGDDAEIFETVRALGVTSHMVVPLVSAGRSFGAISILSSDPQRLFDQADLELACELGRRAGYAVHNARLYREAQDANRAKDEFLATLSHELRTPMTSTLGWASMLANYELSAENFRIAVETIDRSTRAQAKLIDEILDVSRIVTGKLRISVAPVDVRTVILGALDAVRPALAAKGIDLQATLPAAVSAVQGDASRLHQVFWNVLSNAVKFTPPGGAVFVTVEQSMVKELTITVRDTGIGITPKFLPYLFQRFRQADSSSTRTHGGLGLGLSIVRSIVELHGGRVSATSEGEGRGTTFTIVLPVSGPAVADMPPAAETHAPLALSGVSVLLVEDEDDTRYMLSAALQSFGASVTAVPSVDEALESLKTTPPHVVVSDIGMPGQDGIGLILRIRSGVVEAARHVPAIALTAYAGADDRDRILGSGYGWHIAKPADPMVVVRTVRDATGR